MITVVVIQSSSVEYHITLAVKCSFCIVIGCLQLLQANAVRQLGRWYFKLSFLIHRFLCHNSMLV